MSPGSSTVQGRLLVVTETVDMATALQQQRQATCRGGRGWGYHGCEQTRSTDNSFLYCNKLWAFEVNTIDHLAIVISVCVIQ